MAKSLCTYAVKVYHKTQPSDTTSFAFGTYELATDFANRLPDHVGHALSIVFDARGDIEYCLRAVDVFCRPTAIKEQVT